MLKLDAVTTEKGENDLAELIDRKPYQDIESSLPYHISKDASVIQNQNGNKPMPSASDDLRAEIQNIELYADKAATGVCQTVKDICMDESLPHKKILLESSDTTEESLAGIKPSATNTDDNPSGRLTECVTLIMQDLHIASVVAKDAADQYSLCSLVELEDKQKADVHITKHLSDHNISFQPLLSTGDFDMVPRQLDTNKFNRLHIFQENTGQVKHDEVCSTTLASSSITTDSKETSGLVKNYTSVTSLGSLKGGCSTAEVEPSDVGGEKEGGGNVSPSFNPGATTNKEIEENSGNTDSESFIDAQNCFSGEEMVFDGVTSSSRCSCCHKNAGDPSSSGPKSSSGHIVFSGNISLRSDSTTSTRSFAFPILQPDWNSSPVKMAKADGRHLKKHRFWRSGILCCKF
ncbi:unnamed protein product [Musa acuminata subsp. malaccensis]|uniref:(wild Malaysian banana) hypothetical protein n=1 Tax=Musa acuminata subsp. malaccensis TaxID=214687 RepID=A0A804JQ17_MUSAM|nr:PREDICTED: uncharacterized protein LOC103989979 [Musa acuminata subsp. malaccensis]XP_018682784.1 PREDICTED: uncharacterized protein LOC103989979 [Musa acuminata subsp. malaccensis]XP_018682785.1 PREDICTED: uncharacterized protein LOC103989979 [Musa acuminata subsp. malaccensis]XP_018682786.1 PREDICTED: uncharacterized protein LOC103989979 [Musa acuminata subsp. malaccensis]XP_018682787.1 PREDICTED: uncharacterized protein LOC103989979 [Musa acuminata subsp. malaccensis]XP_018682788.1 PREDI